MYYKLFSVRPKCKGTSQIQKWMSNNGKYGQQLEKVTRYYIMVQQHATLYKTADPKSLSSVESMSTGLMKIKVRKFIN